MPSHQGKATASFLCGAGLLVGIMALVAGILGMHVITGMHTMHSSAAVTGTMTDQAGMVQDRAVHSGSGPAGCHMDELALATSPTLPASRAEEGVGTPEQCLCAASCSSLHTMAAHCIPSPKTASLSAPLPGAAVFGNTPDPGTVAAVPGRWSYLPGSPSPGELSISRS